MTTTANAQGTNFRETHFQHADLTPIRGEPKYETLKVLINELKANAQTVHSNLGGGAHGHLGLVLTPQKYNIVAPGTPYVRPPFPGALNIPPGTTNVQAQMMRETHDQAMRDFHETETLHNALMQQVVKAVEPMYLKALRNPVTQSFTVPLNQILHHLMAVYGKINPKTFKTMKEEVENYQYDISLPVDVVFDPIDDLEELADGAEQPMTEAQKINMAFITFQNCGKFKSDLKAWNRKATADKTWLNMKTHFREALEDIRNVDDVTIDQTFDQANMVREVLEGVRAIVRDQVAETIPSYMLAPTNNPSPQNSIPPRPPSQFQNNFEMPSAQVANMVNMPPAYLANAMVASPPPQMAPPPPPPPQMQIPPAPQFPMPTAQQNGFSNFGSRGRGRRRGGRGGRRSQQAQQPTFQPMQQYGMHNSMVPQMYPNTMPAQNPNVPTRRNTSQYCWSHGACAHPGWMCATPLPGHIPHATFQNRMGGCTDFCP